MAMNPSLKSMIEATAKKYPVDRAAPNSVELPVPHLIACLAELGLNKATKKDLLRVVRAALAREAAER